jgi:hypothetical protein
VRNIGSARHSVGLGHPTVIAVQDAFCSATVYVDLVKPVNTVVIACPVFPVQSRIALGAVSKSLLVVVELRFSSSLKSVAPGDPSRAVSLVGRKLVATVTSFAEAVGCANVTIRNSRAAGLAPGRVSKHVEGFRIVRALRTGPFSVDFNVALFSAVTARVKVMAVGSVKGDDLGA